MPTPAHLVDSNILLRIARRDDPDHSTIDAALARLAVDGAILYYTHQNIAEFWNVATRPADRNGFGLTPRGRRPRNPGDREGHGSFAGPRGDLP